MKTTRIVVRRPKTFEEKAGGGPLNFFFSMMQSKQPVSLTRKYINLQPGLTRKSHFLSGLARVQSGDLNFSIRLSPGMPIPFSRFQTSCFGDSGRTVCAPSLTRRAQCGTGFDPARRSETGCLAHLDTRRFPYSTLLNN